MSSNATSTYLKRRPIMEFPRKARATTDIYGGKGYLTGDVLVRNWLKSQADRLLAPQFKKLMDAIENEKKLEEILSVFNTDDKGYPIIGDWMLYRCSINAQKIAGTWGKFGVSADAWKDGVTFSPSFVYMNNGKQIKAPESVEVYTVTTKIDGKVRSFFKAYQVIRAGAEFKFTLNVADDLCEKVEGKGSDKIYAADVKKTETCAEAVLDKMQTVGIGAFRERFGKFEYI
jgi:hypothetical protein